MINWSIIRQSGALGHVISQSQVDGARRIVDATGVAQWPVGWQAYALATASWETARTLQPVDEAGGPAYYTRLYDVSGDRPDLARRMGNVTPGDGPRYRGRGLVQLTWRSNYARFGGILGIDLVNHPELALDPVTATRIMVAGMSRGLFSGGRRLDQCLPAHGSATHDQFAASRPIINGHDHDSDIATVAMTWQSALTS